MISLDLSINLNLSPSELWPVISDTSTLNKQLGFNSMSFELVNGKKIGKSKIWIFESMWEEVPWSWSFEKYIKNSRLYSKGPLKEIHSQWLITSVGDGSLLTIQFQGVAAKKILNPLISIMFTMLGKKFKTHFTALSSREKENKASNQLPQNWHRRIDKINGNVRNNLETLFLHGTNAELTRIQPKKFAREHRLDQATVINSFISLSRQPVFRLYFDLMCPHCRGPSHTLESLGEIPVVAECAACNKQFNSDSEEAVEVVFRPHENFLKLDEVLYCAAEPAHRQQTLFKANLKTDDRVEFNCPEGISDLILNLKTEKNLSSYQLDVSDLESEISLDNIPQRVGKLMSFHNNVGHSLELSLELDAQVHDSLRIGEVLSYSEFSDHFGKQSLSPQVAVSLGQQTILFSDIVGSSEIYRNMGDTIAFEKVKAHFEKNFEIVRRHNGQVVKTLGDSVMAAFPWTADAVRCAIEMQDWFESEKSELKIRISINSGNCLAITLTAGIDYFGNTVNLAAKLQSEAGSGEIILSESMGKLPLGDIIKNRNFNSEKHQVQGSWSKHPLSCYKLILG
jgi:class 3 adenylate cyclase